MFFSHLVLGACERIWRFLLHLLFLQVGVKEELILRRICIWYDGYDMKLFILFRMQGFKIRIVGHETEANKTVYAVQIKDKATKKTKITKLRYSELRQIDQEIHDLTQKLKLNINLPHFPGRKLFGCTNKSEEAINQRKIQLTNYLNDLLTIEKLSSLDLVRKMYLPEPDDQNNKIQSQMRVKVGFDKYTILDNTVIYNIRLHDLNTHEQWVYKARYSELRNVHHSLTHSGFKIAHEFPKKKIFTITNERPQDIEKRRQDLQKYFIDVFSSKEIVNSDVMRYYIQESRKQIEKEKYFEAMRKKKYEN